MADFRKLFYALAIVALFAGFTVSASAQALTCVSLTATNQNIRSEGDAELVGDILLGCQSSAGYSTPAGTLVSGADITVSIPSAIITSKILNPGATTLISEATLIVDDLKDQTCQANAASPTGGISTINGSNCTQYYPGSRTHRVCTDTTNPGGLGVCQVYAATAGVGSGPWPQNTYDGTPGHPNIFAGQPNGSGAVIFRGVPLDPPSTGFTRYIRVTNIRVNAAATGLAAGNPLSQISAIISFQAPAGVGLTQIQTTVASVLTGNGGTKVTEDGTFLQCEYPINDLNTPPDNANLIQESTGCASSSSTSAGSVGQGNGSSSGYPGNYQGHGWCTLLSSTASAAAGLGTDGSFPAVYLNPKANTHPVIQFNEGFQTAWKARNMSLLLGTGGVVVAPATGGGCVQAAPCDGGGNNNNLNSTAYYTYNGSSVPFANATDIAANNPQIRYFTEGGFEEIGGSDVYEAPTGGSGFPYNGNAGAADAGTRMQTTISNIPANSVLSVPTVVWLYNGTINSGVMVLVSATAGNAQASLVTAGVSNLAPLAAASGLASLTTGTTGGYLPTDAQCIGTNSHAIGIACNGYYDVTGPTATITYEILFSDPYSTEVAKIYPIVYYPTGELTSKPAPVQPQPNVIASVTPYTFAPYITQPGGNQVTSPLGQLAGTPRFAQDGSFTSGTGALYFVNKCNCSLLFPFVTGDANYTTGIVVANTSMDPTNSSLAVPGYTAIQSSGTVNLYLFGTSKSTTGTANIGPSASYGSTSAFTSTDTQAVAGSYATFVVGSGTIGSGVFEGYGIAQANFQYCHGLAFLFNVAGGTLTPPLSYLGLVMDYGGLQRTLQIVGDSLGQ